MAWLAVNKDGGEFIFQNRPSREYNMWVLAENLIYSDAVGLPKGTIEKIIGRKLTWEDDTVEI